MITEVSPSATVVLDSNGNGQCAVNPPSGTKWALRLATLSTSTANKHPLGFLYRGSSGGPLQLVDSTFTGDQASSAKVGGALYFSGQWLWAKWTGGDPGATATLQVFGQQGSRTDPFDASPLGEGFANQIVLTAQSLQLGGNGSVGNPGMTFGVNPIPPELVTYYAGLADPGHLIAGTVSIMYDGTSTADYRYTAIFADNGVPPGQQVWYVEGLRGNNIVGETDRWLINPGGAFGNPDIVFSPSIGFLVKALIQSQVNAANAQAYEVEIAGELGVRLTVNGDGSLNWGDGTNPSDTTLSRTSVRELTSNAAWLATSNLAGNDLVKLGIDAESNKRLFLQANGQIRWSDGTNPSDTHLYRTAASVLAADTIKANVSGAGETWHAVTGGVGFAANWADFGGGFQGARYRLMPDGTVSLSGLIKTTAPVPNPTAIFTVPAAYKPANDEDFGCNVAGARLVMQASGTLALADFAGPINVTALGLSGVRYAVAGLT